MTQTDQWLSKLTRQLTPRLRGMGRVSEQLRRYYSRKYQDHPDRKQVIRDFDGDIAITLDRSRYISSQVYWSGLFERDVLSILDQLLEPESVMLDIGANIGVMTLYAAKRVPRGRVLSFEPMPDNYAELEANRRLNGFEQVRTFNLALGEADGEVEMFTSNDLEQHHGFNEGLYSLYASEFRSSKSARVRLAQLDHIVAQEGLTRVDVIKIDVEGAELGVLKGGIATLRRFHPALILEYNPEAYKSADYQASDLFDLLSALSYQFAALGPRGERLELPVNRFTPGCNVYCF
ncbi:MAG: FkbM family methyltransferase [Meiothermus sp.]|nr:FkbM family methyltransferase [Meiothermus sp.]